jgi:ascorbate-specific PTS system EIIC-type component UlaA
MGKFRVEIKWALIFVMMMLIWMVMERITGLHDIHIDKHAIFTNLIAIPAIAIYVFALLDKRKTDYNGYMTYKQGFISGIIITLIVTILSPLTQYLTSNLISPDYFANMIEFAVKEGAMTGKPLKIILTLKTTLFRF